MSKGSMDSSTAQPQTAKCIDPSAQRARLRMTMTADRSRSSFLGEALFFPIHSEVKQSRAAHRLQNAALEKAILSGCEVGFGLHLVNPGADLLIRELDQILRRNGRRYSATPRNIALVFLAFHFRQNKFIRTRRVLKCIRSAGRVPARHHKVEVESRMFIG